MELQIENQLLLQALGDINSAGNSMRSASPNPSAESLISPEFNAQSGGPAMARKQTIEARLTTLYSPLMTSMIDRRARSNTATSSVVSFQDSPAIHGIYNRDVDRSEPPMNRIISVPMNAISEQCSMEESDEDPVEMVHRNSAVIIPSSFPSGSPTLAEVPTMELGGNIDKSSRNSSRRQSFVGRYSFVNNGVVLLPFEQDEEMTDVDDVRIEYEGKLKEMREQNDALRLERNTMKKEIGQVIGEKQDVVHKYQVAMDDNGLKEGKIEDLEVLLEDMERELEERKIKAVELQKALQEAEMNYETDNKGRCYQGWLW